MSRLWKRFQNGITRNLQNFEILGEFYYDNKTTEKSQENRRVGQNCDTGNVEPTP